jgi:hypothetical protein
MWQPWQTAANNCSPLLSVNLKPELNGECDASCAAAFGGANIKASNASTTNLRAIKFFRVTS